jgi:hypothetical protein
MPPNERQGTNVPRVPVGVPWQGHSQIMRPRSLVRGVPSNGVSAVAVGVT